MDGSQLKAGRAAAKMTQVEAAGRLGVSQPYLSQLEKGRRPVTAALARQAVRLFDLPPTSLPPPQLPRPGDPEGLPRQLAALGYEPFAYLRKGALANPAVVTLQAVSQSDLDARVAEALPWVLQHYPDLGWDWLVDNAKRRNVQNRLGFLVSVAGELATRRGDRDAARKLAAVESELEASRLAAETTLGREAMTEAEKSWLRKNRSTAARHWNVLSGMTAESLGNAE